MALLGAWGMDESSGPILDHSGNGRDLTLSGTTTRTTGHTGSGLGMSSQSEGFTGGIAVPPQATVRTFMCWVLDTATPSDGRVLEFYDSTTDTSISRFGFRSGGWHVQISTASDFGRVTIARQIGDWHHLAATYDGETIRLYLDGVLQPETTFPGPMLTTADTFNVLYRAGSGITVDDLRVYDEVLDAATIAALMGTPVGTPSAEEHSGALDLSGAGSLLYISTPAVAADLSASGTGTLDLSGRPRFGGAVSLTGSRSLETEASPAVPGSLPLAGTGAQSRAGSAAASAPLALSGTGALAPAPSSLSVSGGLALSDDGTLTVAPYAAPHVVDLTLTAALADNAWSGAPADNRWSATIDPDRWTGATDS